MDAITVSLDRESSPRGRISGTRWSSVVDQLGREAAGPEILAGHHVVSDQGSSWRSRIPSKRSFVWSRGDEAGIWLGDASERGSTAAARSWTLGGS